VKLRVFADSLMDKLQGNLDERKRLARALPLRFVPFCVAIEGDESFTPAESLLR